MTESILTYYAKQKLSKEETIIVFAWLRLRTALVNQYFRFWAYDSLLNMVKPDSVLGIHCGKSGAPSTGQWDW